jgi:hypothetical protein
MNLTREASLLIKGAALWTGVALAALCIALAGLGFLSAGFFVWMAQHTGYASASAITGGVLLVLALATGLAGSLMLKRMRERRPGLLATFGGTAGVAGRLAGMLVRRDPRKAIVLSVIAGALAEYITSERKK